MSTSEQILIIGPSWVGDMVMAQSLFKQLRLLNTACQIDVVAPAWSKGILERMPEIRNTFTQVGNHGEMAFGSRRELGHALKNSGYDRAITMPRSWKSALIPWFANVPVRTGFRGEWRYGLLNDVRKLDKSRLDQTVKRFVSLAIHAESELPDIPKPALTIDPGNQTRLKREFGLNTDKPVIAMMPGAAFGPAKMWPTEYFAELAKMLVNEGMQVWIIGSEGEKALGEQIRIAAGSHTTNLCGKTGLADTPDLFAMTKATVTNDSGLMHIAAAVGSHVITIYGATGPDFTPPLTDQKTIHFLGLECSPCYERECPLEHLNCLRKISPDLIYKSLLNTVKA
jgi:heptosyltransferase-2